MHSWCVAVAVVKFAFVHADEDTLSTSCGVTAASDSIQSRSVDTKTYDCQGKCPRNLYGEKIFGECCGRCQTFRDKGVGYFGLCHGCPDSDTMQDVTDYLTGQGGRRLRDDTELPPADLDSKTYSAECTVGLSGDGDIPPIALKTWPCGPCQEVPILHTQCCDDCKKQVDRTEPPTFWQCDSCDAYGDRTADIKSWLQKQASSVVEANWATKSAGSAFLLAAVLSLCSTV